MEGVGGVKEEKKKRSEKKQQPLQLCQSHLANNLRGKDYLVIFSINHPLIFAAHFQVIFKKTI